MHRLRMLSSAEESELLHWFQRLAAPWAHKGALLYMEVDNPACPSFIDVGFDHISDRMMSDRLLAEKLSRFILGHWRFRYIYAYLKTRYTYFDADEVEFLTVKAFCRAVKTDHLFECVEDQIYTVLSVEQGCHLDGLIRFRLGAWLRNMQSLVDTCADAYLADQEYEAFIGVLKYFLETTMPIPGILHVIYRQGSIYALDDQGTSIDLSTLTEEMIQATADLGLGSKDVLLSALIAHSPERVIIHTDRPEDEFIQTLMRVFTSRCTFCPFDPDCSIFLSQDLVLWR